MYTVSELVLLARAYIAATGISASRLGILAAAHDRLFIRLFEGYDCRADMVERASRWFDAQYDPSWWPEEVERRRLGVMA